MNTRQFLEDYHRAKRASGLKQNEISKKFCIQQASLSRFERGQNALSFDTALKLWPFVYGHELEEKSQKK